MAGGQWLQRRWFAAGLAPALLPLLPLHGLFCLISTLRRLAYRRGWAVAARLPVPVIVVGNLTVGGAGKTPLTLWLAEALRARDWRPGLISRGYGGNQQDGVRAVTAASRADEVGDEPCLLAARSGLPVYVGRQRAAAGAALLQAHPEVNVLLCDDGLQHYALARDAEIAVFDQRGAGNGWRLPLGPLREPLSRLATVSAVVVNGGGQMLGIGEGEVAAPVFAMHLQPGRFYRLGKPDETCSAAELLARSAGKPCYALAGIGDPGRFFRTLAGLGVKAEAHAFPDHHAYQAADLAFAREGVLLMTEKDAVKCAAISTGEAWVLPVAADVAPALVDILLEKLSGRPAS